MRYIAFIIGIVLLALIGGFVWNIVSDTFSGINIGVPSTSNTSTSSDEVEDSTSDFSQSNDQTSNSSNVINNVTPTSQREGVVTVSRVRRTEGNQSITLRSDLNQGESVNITGWRIESNDNFFVIPQAVNFYDPTNPESNVETDIILEDGHEVNIYFVDEEYYEMWDEDDPDLLPEKDPWSTNLRLNTCTGFLNNDYEIIPELTNMCPEPERDSYRHLSGECQNYIRGLDGCEDPDRSEVYSFRGEQGYECRAFILDWFNVGNCFSNNSTNPDFLSNEWRVWINKTEVFDTSHDWVRLYNGNGTLIDDYDY